MKKLIFFLLLSFLIVGCAKRIHSDSNLEVKGLDFTEYTEQGFKFTPLGRYLDNEYESKGLIEITVYPEIERIIKFKFYDKRYWRKHGDIMIEKVNPEKILKEMYEQAIELDANAIIEFSMQNINLEIEEVIIPSFKISGYAIKRK